MKITGYELLWMVFWICLFSYWGLQYKLNHDLEVLKIQSDTEIAKLRAESRDKMTKSLEDLTDLTRNISN